MAFGREEPPNGYGGQANGQPSNGAGVGALLNGHRQANDIKLVGKAIEQRWPINPERRSRILTVMQQIVETDTFEVEKIEVDGGANGEGVKEAKTATIKMPNHRNQVQAARVLLLADRMNQMDEHKAAPEPSQGPRIIDNRTIILTDPADLEAAERLRAKLNGLHPDRTGVVGG